MDEHLESMVELGLITMIEDSERTYYRITDRGVQYLKRFSELKDMLEYQIENQLGVKYLKYL